MVRISAIFIAVRAGDPMLQKDTVKIFPKTGIEGDRYALGLGAYSKAVPTKTRDISLITREGIDSANRELKRLGLEEFLQQRLAWRGHSRAISQFTVYSWQGRIRLLGR